MIIARTSASHLSHVQETGKWIDQRENFRNLCRNVASEDRCLPGLGRKGHGSSESVGS